MKDLSAGFEFVKETFSDHTDLFHIIGEEDILQIRRHRIFGHVEIDLVDKQKQAEHFYHSVILVSGLKTRQTNWYLRMLCSSGLSLFH